MKKFLCASVALFAVSTPALAGVQTISGSTGGLSWTATSRIVGQGSTGTAAAATPGLATYFARNSDIMPGTTNKNYSGTVGLFMRYSNGDQFVCSGTLLNDRQSILTAGHCVSNGYAANAIGNGKAVDLVSTTAVFVSNANSDADAPYYTVVNGLVTPTAGNVGIGVQYYNVNKGYTGEVIDQNDIAVLKLSELAPAFAQSYDVYTGNDLTGQRFNVASFGTRSTTGGSEGTTNPDGTSQGAGPNRRREGDNRYDYRFGDAAFGGFFTTRDASGDNFFGKAQVDYSYVSDFDNGRAANDASCLLGVDVAGASFATTACQAGLTDLEREVSIAGGDSGGGAFINGQIASINSYGLSFGADYGDYKDGLQSSWGEFNGFVPTFIHRDFIAGAIPEPQSWAMMLAGFAFAGGALRRRRQSLTVRFA